MREPIDYEQLVTVASQAARHAGDHALQQMNQARITIKQGTTGDEMVTQLDKESQDTIIATLQAAFPNHGFIGEEGVQNGILKQLPTDPDGVWWIIDPIDGTNNFARGLSIFAVSIGAFAQGRPVAGVIYAPAQGQLFSATANGPALLNGTPIETGTECVSPFTSVSLDSHFGDTLSPGMIEIMQRCRFRSLGSAALHLAYVASGALAGSVLCQPKLWDIAAGVLIAERANALTTNWQGKGLWPMDLERYEGEKIPCITANQTAHGEIVGIMSTQVN